MKKEGSRRKTSFEKKNESRSGSPGSGVDLPSRPGFARFLHWLVFCLTRTGPATGLTRAGSGLITMILGQPPHDLNFFQLKKH